MIHTANPSTRSTSTLALRRLALPALVVALALGVTACGSEDPAPVAGADVVEATPITIADPWVRATKGSEDPSMTGAFMVLENPRSEDVTLVRVTSPIADMVQLHEMAMIDGEMAMQEVTGGLVIPAGADLELKPGSFHVMLMGLTGRLSAGDEVNLTLEFSDGSTEEFLVPVKAFTEEEGHYHSPSPDGNMDDGNMDDGSMDDGPSMDPSDS